MKCQYSNQRIRIGGLALAALAVMLWVGPARAAHNVTLAWNANTETNLAGYKLYWGTASGSYTRSNVLNTVTSGTITNLSSSVTYFFAVTAYNTAGLESGFSTQVSWTSPTNAPPVLSMPAPFVAQKDITRPVQFVQVSDIDVGSSNMTMTIAASHGILTVRNNVASGVTAGQITGNGSGTVAVTATMAALNQTLSRTNGLLYVGVFNYVGPDTLQVTVTDNGGPGASAPRTDVESVAITVQGDIQDTWRTQFFTTSDLTNPAKEATVWGASADPDQDGQDNLMEYALGLDPLDNETTSLVLQSGLVDSGGQKYATITFFRRKNDPLLQYIPEVSTNKVTFLSGPSYIVQTGVSSVDAIFEVASYQDLTAIGTNTSRFIRLRVVR